MQNGSKCFYFLVLTYFSHWMSCWRAFAFINFADILIGKNLLSSEIWKPIHKQPLFIWNERNWGLLIELKKSLLRVVKIKEFPSVSLTIISKAGFDFSGDVKSASTVESFIQPIQLHCAGFTVTSAQNFNGNGTENSSNIHFTGINVKHASTRKLQFTKLSNM